MTADPLSTDRFARVAAAFAAAWNAVPGERCEASFNFAGEVARLRIVGDRLARQLCAAIAHLRVDPATPATLTIDLWDVRASAVAQPFSPDVGAGAQSWRVGNGTFAASGDARVISHQLDRSMIWFDRHAGSMVGWFATADDLSLHQRGKPLQLVLTVRASDRGIQAVHAALVARDGEAVLIPGRSGSGKSTAALCCLRAGYTYYGDDWIGIRHGDDGAVRAVGLYSSTFLDPEHARRFPQLASHLILPGAEESKALLLLHEIVPAGLGNAATIRALALPRIVAIPSEHVRRAAKRDAMLVLLPSSIFEMVPRAGRAGIDGLAQLVERIPVYWLEMDHDVDAIASRVDAILAAVGASV